MVRVLSIIILLYLFVTTAFCQSVKSSKDTLKSHVYYLASEKLKGRNTGEKGQKLAAFYIRDAFKRYQLAELPNNSYYHYYSLLKKHKNYHTLKSNGNVVFWPWHFFYTASVNHDDSVSSQLQFCGYGSLPEVEKLDLANKSIALIAQSPNQAFENIKKIRKTYGNKTFIVLFPEKSSEVENAWSNEFEMTYYSLPNKFESYEIKKITEEWANPVPDDSLRIYYCFPDVMRNIFGTDDGALEKIAKNNLNVEDDMLANITSPWVTYQSSFKDTIEKVVVENVGGLIYGKDTTQTIVVTAHYDHIGEDFGKINYGADDNASGVSVLLESARQLSEIFSSGNTPNRNILFMAFSGEEMGLLGSEAYVRNPLFPLNKTVININMDMLGRWDERHTENKDFVYILTAGENSKSYFKLGKKKIKAPYGFEVSNNPGPKEKMIFKTGSDHYSFYQRNVPIAVFFTGLHEDYHTPNDTPDKLNYTNLTHISDLVTKYIYKISMDTVRYPLR